MLITFKLLFNKIVHATYELNKLFVDFFIRRYDLQDKN